MRPQIDWTGCTHSPNPTFDLKKAGRRDNFKTLIFCDNHLLDPCDGSGDRGARGRLHCGDKLGELL